MYRCAEAMVVTNSAFTQQAETQARAAGVELVGRDGLIRALLEARGTPEPLEAPAAPAVGDSFPPFCPIASARRRLDTLARMRRNDRRGTSGR
jgi:Zn-dependent protease with chaperone function